MRVESEEFKTKKDETAQHILGLLQSEFFTTFIAYNLLNLLNHSFAEMTKWADFNSTIMYWIYKWISEAMMT